MNIILIRKLTIFAMMGLLIGTCIIPGLSENVQKNDIENNWKKIKSDVNQFNDVNVNYSKDVDWWPMFHHDLEHIGYSSSIAPDEKNIEWSYSTNLDFKSSPAVSDDKVFIGSDDKNVYCLDADTGSKIWSFITNGVVDSSPAVADGKVYFGSRDGSIYCLDINDGSEIWTYETFYHVRSSPAVVAGKVFIGSDDYNVYCLDMNNGSKIWTYETDYHVRSSPAVVAGKVFIGSSDHNIYCLDIDTGNRNWSFTTDGKVDSSPAIADGKIFIGSDDKNVYCLDMYDGSEIWKYTTGSSVYSSPAVGDGKVFIGSRDDHVYCLDATTGSKLWEYKTGSSVYSSPAVADGKVYVGSWDRSIYCLDMKSGSEIWKHTTGSSVYSSPAVADGKVYVGSWDDTVYCFGGGNKRPTANFTYNPLHPHSLEVIQFSDTSVDTDGFIESWFWDFGDGNTNNDQHPTHQYIDNGTYLVTLNVIDNEGGTDFIDHIVIISNIPPVAVNDSANVPEDTSTDIDVTSNDYDSDGSIDVTSVIVTDGDHGSTSVNGATGVVTYTPEVGYIGADSFTYTVDDEDGAKSNTATVYITVIKVEPPNAEFSFLPVSPSTADTIQFTDESTDDDSIVSWNWDFDDGSGTSTDQDPTYSYSDDGVFTVKLTVWDNEGASDSVQHPVMISNLPPVAVNDISSTTMDVPVDIVVTSNDYDSDGSIDVTSVIVTDGDHGSTSVNGATGVVTYAPEVGYIGADSFTYTVDDDDGATSNTATAYVSITGDGEIEDIIQEESGYPYMVYGSRWARQSFIPSIDLLSKIKLLIGKTGVPADDLTVSIRSSLTDADIESITVPESSIPLTATWFYFDLPDMSIISGNTYYIVVHTSGGNSANCYFWSFGYNTAYTDGTLQFSDNSGSSWLEYSSYDFCFITYGGGGGPQVPVFSYDPTSRDFGNMLEGTTDSTTFDIWNSGTGTLTYSLSESCDSVDISSTSGSSTGEHDTITVDIDTTGLSEDSHSCDIVITSDGGSGTFTVSVNVIPPSPNLEFSPSSHDFGNMLVDETDSTTFDIWNSGTGTLTYSLSESCDWIDISSTSGDSTGENDTITVNVDTTDLSVDSHNCDILISSNGGSGVFTVDFTVVEVEPPNAEFSFLPANPSINDTIQFTDESTDDDTIVSWDWDFDDGSGTSTDQNPTYSYSNEGTYTVTLTVTDNDGLIDTVTRIIYIETNEPVITVEIIFPNEDSVVEGIIVINGTAKGENAIQRVYVRIGSGSWMIANGTELWSFEWDTEAIVNGRYIIYAKSYDGTNYSKSDSVDIIVKNPTHPTNQIPNIIISHPMSLDIVSGTIKISGTASDSDGVIKNVEIKIDSGSWIIASGTNSWSYEWDTTNLINGNHIISARSYDDSEYSLTEKIIIIVQNDQGADTNDNINTGGEKFTEQNNLSDSSLILFITLTSIITMMGILSIVYVLRIKTPE